MAGEDGRAWLDGADLSDWIFMLVRTDPEVKKQRGITFILVDLESPGIEIRPILLISGAPPFCESFFRDVRVPVRNVVGEVDGGFEPLCEAVDAATVALCGEMLGGMSEAFDRTLEYLKTREQFAVPIGSFQALQHRAAKLFIEIELCRSAVMAAARALDDCGDDAAALVSNAKARCSDAYLLVANEALQMHGGIGMTDEHDIGFFLKHARVAGHTFGDAAFHRGRFARLKGF